MLLLFEPVVCIIAIHVLFDATFKNLPYHYKITRLKSDMNTLYKLSQ